MPPHPVQTFWYHLGSFFSPCAFPILSVETIIVPLLRLLAGTLAGAAVSAVGGGQLAPGPPATRRPPPSLPFGRGVRESTDVLDSSGAAAGAGSGIGTRGSNGLGSEGIGGPSRDGGTERRAAWSFVESGAFGGALYAVTAGGVFETVIREYVLGEFRCVCWSAGIWGGGGTVMVIWRS